MQRLLSRLILAVALIGMLIGFYLLVFYVTIPLKELPPQLALEMYKPHGHRVEQQIITSDDPVYRRLKSFLDSERTGWQWNVITIAPGPYALRAEGLTIRCYTNLMVIDVYDPPGHHPRSYRKDVPNLLQTLGLPESSEWKDWYEKLRTDSKRSPHRSR